MKILVSHSSPFWLFDIAAGCWWFCSWMDLSHQELSGAPSAAGATVDFVLLDLTSKPAK